MKKVEISRGSAQIKVGSIEKINEIEQLNQLISDGKLKVMMIQAETEDPIRTMISQPEGQILKVHEQNPSSPQDPESGLLKANSFFDGTGDGTTPFVKTFDQEQNGIYLKNKSTEQVLTLTVNGETFKLDPLEFIDEGLDPFEQVSILVNGSFKGYAKRFADKQTPLMQFFNDQYFDGAYFG